MSLIDRGNSHFGGGVVNRSAGSIFSSLKTLDPTRYHIFFDDFDHYGGSTEWTETIDSIGSAALTEVSSGEGDGGVLELVSGTIFGEVVGLNKIGESFRFEKGKRLFFKSRFKVSDAVQTEIIVGLQVTDSSARDVSDGVFFITDDEQVNVRLVIEKNNTQTVLPNVVDLVDNTYVTLSYYWNGIDAIWAGLGDTPTQKIEVGDTLPDDIDLTVSLHLKNGIAASRTMWVDYVFIAKERD